MRTRELQNEFQDEEKWHFFTAENTLDDNEFENCGCTMNESGPDPIKQFIWWMHVVVLACCFIWSKHQAFMLYIGCLFYNFRYISELFFIIALCLLLHLKNVSGFWKYIGLCCMHVCLTLMHNHKRWILHIVKHYDATHLHVCTAALSLLVKGKYDTTQFQFCNAALSWQAQA